MNGDQLQSLSPRMLAPGSASSLHGVAPKFASTESLHLAQHPATPSVVAAVPEEAETLAPAEMAGANNANGAEERGASPQVGANFKGMHHKVHIKTSQIYLFSSMQRCEASIIVPVDKCTKLNLNIAGKFSLGTKKLEFFFLILCLESP